MKNLFIKSLAIAMAVLFLMGSGASVIARHTCNMNTSQMESSCEGEMTKDCCCSDSNAEVAVSVLISENHPFSSSNYSLNAVETSCCISTHVFYPLLTYGALKIQEAQFEFFSLVVMSFNVEALNHPSIASAAFHPPDIPLVSATSLLIRICSFLI
jgi:hypothetical protein